MVAAESAEHQAARNLLLGNSATSAQLAWKAVGSQVYTGPSSGNSLVDKMSGAAVVSTENKMCPDSLLGGEARLQRSSPKKVLVRKMKLASLEDSLPT